MRFQEDFLHFVWQFRLFSSLNLFTQNDEAISIIQVGNHNTNAGPDFINAKLEIAGTLWAGNVEIHLKSSDWYLHQHQNDDAYANVVLHVVYEDDEPVLRKDGTFLPTLVLENMFPLALLHNYEKLIQSVHSFPCQNHIRHVDDFLIDSFLSRVLVERLAQKSEEVFAKLNDLKGDWDETFYHFMARNIGFKVNALPMEMLAQSLPQQLFAKHKNQPLQIEALIFGQAGFLSQEFEADYPNQLKQEYLFLKKKYKLTPIDISLWKFLRMRPQNFPTLRLAQFSALITKSRHLFSKVLEVKKENDYLGLFEDLPMHNFWKTHYHFNKTANKVGLQLGKTAVENLLINTVALFLFAYGKFVNQQNYITRAINLLEQLPAENNAIIKLYQLSGVSVKNAQQSQALLQLKKKYCNEKKCLNCGIGIKILKQ